MRRMFRHVFSLCAVLVVSATTASAQFFESYESNKDETGKIIRGSYLTNQWYDNWAFSLSGGAQTMITAGDISTARITPLADFSVTKWVTPTLAARLGFLGWKLEENFTPDNFDHYLVKTNADRSIAYYTESYVHGDLLLSLTNFLGGYKMNRFANLAPYAHFGYLRLGHPDYGYFNNVYRDREIAGGLGMTASFRITDNIAATLDYRNMFISGRFHDAHAPELVCDHMLSAGLSYTIKKWYWTRARTIEHSRDEAMAARAEAEQILKKVEEEKKDLEVKVATAETQIVNAEARAEVAEKSAEEANAIINSSDSELVRQIVALKAEKNRLEQLSKANPGDEFLARAAASDFIVYFNINSDKISNTELIRLDAYIRQISVEDPDHIFYLTGSADEGTGNLTINTRLSKSRAANVKKLLLKYGVPEGQIVIKATIVTHEHEDGSLDRCVLFENR